MSEFKVVPTFDGSPWAKRPLWAMGPGAGSVLAIYCPHQPTPWLVGSFTLHTDLTARTGTPHWSWRDEYPTGDGYWIRLKGIDAPASTQYLADNTVRDRAAEGRALSDALASGDGSHLEAANAAAEAAATATRVRVVMKCGICSFGRAFRAEAHLHRIVQTFWALDFREVPLTVFARRVDRRAK